jgi:hypothetical protein
MWKILLTGLLALALLACTPAAANEEVDRSLAKQSAQRTSLILFVLPQPLIVATR